jgi:hypothetical protein
MGEKGAPVPVKARASLRKGSEHFYSNSLTTNNQYINKNTLNAITLSLRATKGSVPARRSAAFQHAGVAISSHKQEIASSSHSSQ